MNLKFFAACAAVAVLTPMVRHLLGIAPPQGYPSYATGALTAVTFVLGGLAYMWANR